MNNRIPVNSLSRHIEPLTEQLTRRAAEVIGKGHFVLGPSVARFEVEFAEYCGVPHCVSVANGTDALEISLRAVRIGAGSRVAVVANAAMYGTTAVLACGAEPVFVDIDRDSRLMSVDSLRSTLSAGEIDAVIVTHLYGKLADMDALVPLCSAHGAMLIEDCAQAHGAQDASGQKAGSFGDAASFSFYPTKNLGALGDGGAVVTRHDVVAEKARKLRQYGWSRKYTNDLPGGRNSRLDEIQAAFLSEMLPLVDGWNSRRRQIANRYSSELGNSRVRATREFGNDYVAHLYVIEVEGRDDLARTLDEKGIQTDVHYPIPDHRQPVMVAKGTSVELPVTEHLAERVLTLPCFPEMTDEEVSRVVEAVNGWGLT